MVHIAAGTAYGGALLTKEFCAGDSGGCVRLVTRMRLWAVIVFMDRL